jgi:uncharacterized protein
LSDWNDPAELAAGRDRLLAILAGYGRTAVAFSGGIDSTVVAQAAQMALGDRAVAVTGVSDSLASGELDEARALARRMGIRHEVIATHEFSDPEYLRNAPDRCYHCKTELYSRLVAMRDELDVDVIASGANMDDLGDYRPGLQAAAEHAIRHPLQEAGLGKDAIRALARAWGLPTWAKPASPCLSSRIAYGEEVTPERVHMIDAAEQWLESRGLKLLRVRYHKGDLARIEVPVEELARLASDSVRHELVPAFRALGFKFVTLDLEGFRSGSLNTLVPVGDLVAIGGAVK